MLKLYIMDYESVPEENKARIDKEIESYNMSHSLRVELEKDGHKGDDYAGVYFTDDDRVISYSELRMYCDLDDLASIVGKIADDCMD